MSKLTDTVDQVTVVYNFHFIAMCSRFHATLFSSYIMLNVSKIGVSLLSSCAFYSFVNREVGKEYKAWMLYCVCH